MQAQLTQFESSLSQPVKKAYAFAGEEPLLLMEAVDKLRLATKKQGFEERIVFDVGNDFDWSCFIEETQAMSLFSDQKMIVLNIPTGKAGKTGSKAISDYCANPVEDIVLVLACGKVEFRGGKPPAWFKKVEDLGMSVRLWPVKREALPNWIKQRANKLNLNLSPEAISIVVDRTDGNLLATAQELDKLTLLGLTGEISKQEIVQSLSDSSRYSIYECIDAALAGKYDLTIKMIYSLKAEHFPEAIAIWALMNDLQKFEQLAWAKRTSGLSNRVFMKYQIWKNRQGLVISALNKHNYAFWAGSVAYCAKIERVVKGRQQSAKPYEQILDLLLQIAGKPLYKPDNKWLQRTGAEVLVVE
jgi:DNA polymerase-3 subunit delta